ncbi:phosphotransferase [Georgenia wangjunii]|uniref:phosphotransferase n=1 Tax=Georgenia wangjunii TaxID=3117730 RepID=UPI002F269687
MDARLAAVERDEVALLSGPGAGELLGAALAADGAVLGEWVVHTVHHRPGAGVSVGYSVRVVRPGEDPGGVDDYLCATTARLDAAAGAGLVRLERDGTVVHVWRHPGDPELPALPVACSPDLLAARLGTREQPRVELLAYRPLRRAVVRVEGAGVPGGRAYVKVVRPHAVAAFDGRHRMLTDAGVPAPRSLGAHDDGMVVLSAGAGTPLASALARGLTGDAAREVLTDVVGVLDRLPEGALTLPRRPAWSERAAHYAHAAATAMPEHASRITDLAEGIAANLLRTDPGPRVPTHGDLYEANLLMEGTRVSALLDVDAVGPGHRADDLACLLAHVSVLPHLAPASYPRVADTLREWTRMCEDMCDPAALWTRCAGVVLSLVAGARRTSGQDWRRDAEGRLAEAERWLAAAH